jgi:hypothetical protein
MPVPTNILEEIRTIYNRSGEHVDAASPPSTARGRSARPRKRLVRPPRAMALSRLPDLDRYDGVTSSTASASRMGGSQSHPGELQRPGMREACPARTSSRARRLTPRRTSLSRGLAAWRDATRRRRLPLPFPNRRTRTRADHASHRIPRVRDSVLPEVASSAQYATGGARAESPRFDDRRYPPEAPQGPAGASGLARTPPGELAPRRFTER